MPDQESLSDSPLIAHLAALRATLLQICYATLICFPITWVLSPFALDWLIEWCCPPELQGLYYFSPMEVFIVKIKFSLILAFVLAFPCHLRSVWKFLLPALYAHERKILILMGIGSTILFAGGIAFCLVLLLPLVMRFSASFATPGLQPMLNIESVLSLTLWLAIGCGLMFQFPIVVVLLVKLNLCSVETLKAKRPYIIVGILILAAILTPPDAVSQILLTLPGYLLFELGIMLCRFFPPDEELLSTPPKDTTMAEFYDQQSH